MPLLACYIKSFFCRKIFFFLLNILCIQSSQLNAQIGKPYSISFTDTLHSATETTLLYNNVAIKKQITGPLSLHISVQCTSGWSVLAKKIVDTILVNNDEYILPIILIKKNSLFTTEQNCNICIASDDSAFEKTVYSFKIISESVSSFAVEDLNYHFSAKTPRDLVMGFNLKNRGNLPGGYHILIQNDKLNIHLNKFMPLSSGHDTTLKYTFHVSKKDWALFTNESVQIGVADSLFLKKFTKKQERFARSSYYDFNNNKTFSVGMQIARQDSVFSMHASDYSPVKMGIESGFIGSSQQLVYYGALQLDYNMNPTSKIDFNYRSRQYGLYNAIDKDVFTLGLQTKHWNLRVGKIFDSKYFITYGNGISVSYKWNQQTQLTFFGVKHTPGFFTTNDNAGINIRYAIKKAIINHDIAYNSDSASSQQSFIYNNDLNIRLKKINFSLNGGFGNKFNSKQNLEKSTKIGSFGGYRVDYRFKTWTFSSQFKKYGNHFPGLYAGSSSQNHSVNYHKKKFSISAYFLINSSKNNFFKDTLLNKDILTFNVKKYGALLSLSPGRSTFSIGLGEFLQTGMASYSFTPRYQFVELQYNYLAKSFFSINLSSTNGYSANAKYSASAVYFTLSTMSINFKNGGLQGGITSIPRVDSIKKIMYNSTMFGGPYFSISIGRKIKLGAQYNLSKTLFDNRVNSFAGLNFAYNNLQNATSINININSPISKVDENNGNPFRAGYINISLRKSFNIPFIFSKKYHSITTSVYEDENANGIADAGERRLGHIPFMINDLHIITDKNGQAIYKHVDKNSYTFDFGVTSIKGLTPRTGLVQKFISLKDTNIIVLFSKARVINGHVEINQDEEAKDKFSFENIKIIVLDKAGNNHSTITDSKGNYFFNLPEGKYEVMLNEEAFNQNYFPEQLSFNADLVNNETLSINFLIKQRQRKIKILNSGNQKEVDVKSPTKDPVFIPARSKKYEKDNN